jgi:hypothetical protein
MAEEVSIDILIETAESATKIGEIKKSLRDLKSAALEAGQGSEDFNRLSTAAGNLQDRVNDVNDTIRVLAGNTTEKLTRSFSSLAQAGIGGFQAIAGAQAVFGSENEDLQKQMVKLQGLLNLSQGIAQFANIGQAAKDFKTVMVSLVPQLFTATAAQEGLNVAMSLNPAGILITAILALGAAYVLFSDDTEDAAEAQKKLNAEQEEYNKLLDSEVDKLRDKKSVIGNDIERELDLARARGATLTQIRDLEVKLTEARLNELSAIKGFRGKLNAEEIEEEKDLKNQLLIIDANYRAEINKREAEKLEKRKVRDLEEIESLKLQGEVELQTISDKQNLIAENNSSFEARQIEASKQFNVSRESLMNEFYASDIEDFETFLQTKADKEKQYGIQGAKQQVQYAQAGFNALVQLDNLLFTIEQNNLSKKQKESLKYQKLLFQRNKALQLVNTVINTASGVVEAAPDPARMALVGIAGQLAFATILAQRFNPDTGTASSSPASSPLPSITTAFNNGGGGSSPSSFSPSSSLVNPITPTFTGTAGAFGGNAVQAFVLESELTDAQLRAELIRRRARMR